MSDFYIVNSDRALKEFLQKAVSLYHEKKWLKWSPSFTKRSLPANALSHVWYTEISKQLHEETVAGAKDFCKLTFGVPILRQKEKFNNFYTMFFVSLSYEKQLASMKYLSITSVMDTQEMKLYMENVKLHFEGRGVFLSEAKEVTEG